MGNNFSAGSTVSFNGTYLAATYLSSTQMVITAPAGSGTNVPLYVTGNGQTSNTNNSFSYLNPTATTTVTPTATNGSGIKDYVPFPNPSDGLGSLSFYYDPGQYVSQVKVKIFTLAFRKIYEDDSLPTTAGQNLYTLDWGRTGVNMANGLYYLEVVVEGLGFETRKVMKVLVLR